MLQMAYEDYSEHVMPGGRHRYDRIWNATDDLGCSHHEVDGYKFPPFRCALGECTECPEYTPHPVEETWSEPICYYHFLNHKYCSIHRDTPLLHHAV